jgi:hypothetical protein
MFQIDEFFKSHEINSIFDQFITLSSTSDLIFSLGQYIPSCNFEITASVSSISGFDISIRLYLNHVINICSSCMLFFSNSITFIGSSQSTFSKAINNNSLTLSVLELCHGFISA